MAGLPAEAAGVAGVPGFGALAWAMYLVAMAAIGACAGVILGLLLLAPRMKRS
ncbi:MAG: hypothetical protein Q6373_007010 [Candidatus Sigynarchaeota archaeon]